MGLFGGGNSTSLTKNLTQTSNKTTGASGTGNISANDSTINVLDGGAIKKSIDLANNSLSKAISLSSDIQKNAFGFSQTTFEKSLAIAADQFSAANSFTKTALSALSKSQNDNAKKAQAVELAAINSTKSASQTSQETTNSTIKYMGYGVILIVAMIVLKGAK